MENHIEETNQDVHGLENLPENQRNETKEILADIQKEEDAKANESKKDEGDQKPEDKKPEDEGDKKPEDKGDKDGKKDGEEGTQDKLPRRDTKLVPSYILGIEKTKFEKREKELMDEIDALKTGAKPNVDGEKKEPTKVEIKSLVDKIVTDNEIADPKVISDIFEAVDAYVKDKTQLPPEILAKLQVVDELKSQHEIALEEINFSKDFDKQILPLIKAEYGDDIPEDKVAEIKEKLKGIAYSDEYAKVSYDEIYRGKNDFRGLHTPKKRSAEGTRQTAVDLKAGEKTYTEELSEEEYNKLTPAEQQKYEDAMARRERKG